jgi:hypothetical protein
VLLQAAAAGGIPGKALRQVDRDRGREDEDRRDHVHHRGLVGAEQVVQYPDRQCLQTGAQGECATIALVNAQGRVIVSNSVRRVTGSLVREVDVPAWWMTQAPLRGGTVLRRCGDAPIALITP